MLPSRKSFSDHLLKLHPLISHSYSIQRSLVVYIECCLLAVSPTTMEASWGRRFASLLFATVSLSPLAVSGIGQEITESEERVMGQVGTCDMENRCMSQWDKLFSAPMSSFHMVRKARNLDFCGVSPDFKVIKWLKTVLVICGSSSNQTNPIEQRGTPTYHRFGDSAPSLRVAGTSFWS